MNTVAGAFGTDLSPVARAYAQRNQAIIINRDWNSNRSNVAFIPDQFQGVVRSRFQTEHEMHGRVAANSLLSSISAIFKFGAACVEGSDSELCAFAKRRADHCAEILARTPNPEPRASPSRHYAVRGKLWHQGV